MTENTNTRKVIVQHNFTINGKPSGPFVLPIDPNDCFEHGKTFSEKGFIGLLNAYCNATFTHLLTSKTDEELILEFT